MSTYDAYNLSLRDSTEFTVPTGGGSESSGRLDIFKIKIRIDPGNSSPDPIKFMFCRIEQNLLTNSPLVRGLGQDAGVPISVDNEQHEIEAVAVDGNTIVGWTDDNLSIKSTSDTISVEGYEGNQYIVASGDGNIDFAYNDNNNQQ